MQNRSLQELQYIPKVVRFRFYSCDKDAQHIVYIAIRKGKLNENDLRQTKAITSV